MNKELETIEEVVNTVIGYAVELSYSGYEGSINAEAIKPGFDVMQSIEKIIKERVIGEDETGPYYIRNQIMGIARNGLRANQRQALTTALYGKGEDGK